jgi:hypothetical protein
LSPAAARGHSLCECGYKNDPLRHPHVNSSDIGDRKATVL